MKKILLVIGIFFSFWGLVYAEEDLAPNAKSAILVDNLTGEVLFEKNADEALAPASMTKLGSMLLIMEAIDNGTLKFSDMVTISKDAASMGGSQVFLQEGESYSVHDLLKGISIASGNDAVYAMAEKIGGTHDNFVSLLNKRLKEIGTKNTNFVNAHGLDTEGHTSSARDMAIIARELLKHEKILEYTSIYEEYLEKNDGSKIWLVNTNRLVRFYDGLDGLKTGYTSNAGYCLTATAKKDNFRLISVVMGEDSSENRSSDTVKMLNYAFNTYKINIIKTKDEVLGKVRVERGKENVAEITLVRDATELLKNTDKTDKYSFNLKVKSIKAPIKAGEVVGKAEIIDGSGNIIDEVDVTVNKDIKKANIIDYLIRNLKTIAVGKSLLRQKM